MDARIKPFADHALLIAGAAVNQAATPTAVLAEQIAQQHRAALTDQVTALVRVFAAEDAEAALQLRGSFHPRLAQAPQTRNQAGMMKPDFTLAF